MVSSNRRPFFGWVAWSGTFGSSIGEAPGRDPRLRMLFGVKRRGLSFGGDEGNPREASALEQQKIARQVRCR